eukprot:5556669-Ditylum_brightwellii.AAC.1
MVHILCDTAQLCNVWVLYNFVCKIYAKAIVPQHVAQHIVFTNLSDPASTTDLAINHLLHQPSPIAYAWQLSAAFLSTQHPPSSLDQHSCLPSHDSDIWDGAYIDEYFGLHTDTKTWQYILEADCKHFQPIVGWALLSFALATIKYDEHGCPHCA